MQHIKSNTVTFRIIQASEVSAKELVLSLLSASDHGQRNLSELKAAGDIFQIESTAIRMALSRLTKEDRVRQVARSIYAIGRAAEPLRDQGARWQDVPTARVAWNADWFCALTGHLGRTDRKALRSRARSMVLFGFRQAQTDVWVRPANLKASLAEIRQQQERLGLQAGVMHLHIREARLQAGMRWQELWDTCQLERNYEAAINAMQTSLGGLSEKAREARAQETFLVGQSVLKLLNTDPLLPAEMIDDELLLSVCETMRRYDEFGKEAWSEVFEASH